MTLFSYEQEQTTSDDYYTPAWLFEDMGVEFDLDVASPPGGVSWIPAKRFLTMADDGLSTPWDGRVWMNPPFSGYAEWAEKFLAHGNGIALSPIVSNSKWPDRLWETVDGVVLLRRDMKFAQPNGGQKEIMWRTALWAMGGWAVEAIGRVGHVR